MPNIADEHMVKITFSSSDYAFYCFTIKSLIFRKCLSLAHWSNSEHLRDYLSNQYPVFLPSPHYSTLFHIRGVGKPSPLLDCVCVFLVWLRCSRVSLMVPRMHCGCGRGQWDTWDATQCGIFYGHIFFPIFQPYGEYCTYLNIQQHIKHCLC